MRSVSCDRQQLCQSWQGFLSSYSTLTLFNFFYLSNECVVCKINASCEGTDEVVDGEEKCILPRRGLFKVTRTTKRIFRQKAHNQPRLLNCENELVYEFTKYFRSQVGSHFKSIQFYVKLSYHLERELKVRGCLVDYEDYLFLSISSDSTELEE